MPLQPSPSLRVPTGRGSPPSLPSRSARADCNVLCGVFDVVTNELPVKPRKCGVSNGHGSGKGPKNHDVLVFWDQKTAGGWRGFAPVARVIGAEVYLQARRLPPAAACRTGDCHFPCVKPSNDVSQESSVILTVMTPFSCIRPGVSCKSANCMATWW